MSKLSVIGLLMIICVIAFVWINFRGGLNGNGHVTTETRAAGHFDKLMVNGVFRTIVSQDGGDEWVKVQTDENLQQIVVVENKSGTLSISTKANRNYKNASKMVVYVNVKTLNSLVNKSVGMLESSGQIKADELELKNDAVGKTIVNLDAKKLRVDMNAVGLLHLSGKSEEAFIENNGVGKLEAFDLKSDMLTIKNNGVGAVEVYAAKEISIDHNGVGKLEYKGDAEVKNLKNNGVGKVTKVN